MNNSLYNLTTELSILEEVLAEQEVENPEDLAKKQEQLFSLIQSKTDACVGYAQSLDDYAALISSKRKELGVLQSQIESKREKYESYVKQCLERLGVKKLSGNMSSMTIRKPTKIVNITNTNEIPSEFLKIVESVDIDKKAIKETLTNGVDVPGAELIDGKSSINFKLGK